MILRYIRLQKNEVVGISIEDIIGGRVPTHPSGGAIGVLAAELRGTNVFVGFSLMHPLDMDDRVKMHGFNKEQKKEAVRLALEKAAVRY